MRNTLLNRRIVAVLAMSLLAIAIALSSTGCDAACTLTGPHPACT